MSTTTDLIDGEIAAYRARNLDEFLSCYSADAVIRDADGNVLMEGELQMREFYGPLFRDSPDLRVEIPRRIEFGDYVIDEEPVDGEPVAPAASASPEDLFSLGGGAGA